MKGKVLIFTVCLLIVSCFNLSAADLQNSYGEINDSNDELDLRRSYSWSAYTSITHIRVGGSYTYISTADPMWSSNYWVKFALTSDWHNSLLAVALTAQATGAEVRFYVNSDDGVVTAMQVEF